MNIHSKRNTCRLCETSQLKIVLPLKPVPIGEHYSEKCDEKNDKRYEIDLYQCSDCGVVQTQDDISSDFLWSGYTYFSGQTSGIKKHFTEFVENFSNYKELNQKLSVFDIGSNDGSLLEQFKKKGCNVFGIDPSCEVADVANAKNIPTYVGLFDDKVVKKFPASSQKADVITAFNVFAHSPNMQGMISGVKQMLTDEGIFCFEVQYLKSISKKKLLGTIFHEHMIHYSIYSANMFLRNYGFKIIGFEENSIQMGSIIFYCAHAKSGYKECPLLEEAISHEVDCGITDSRWAENFSSYINEQRKKVQKFIDGWKNKRLRVIGYGAARSGPTLAIQFGLEHVMEYIIDDHPSKSGKYGVFESLEVKPTAVLGKLNVDICIVLAWIHAKNIIINNRHFLNEGGEFLVLWPEVELINIKNVDVWLKKIEELKND